ncbi:hypothetical protein [Jeotgalicoccus sp. WY2]|uniref:hypothetical protein n=1 Tax=Jeotgalicoccus sp. WY2 TaxID=2708346 RepID=UPI0020202433|nr:hypothetical protein [Jeotgalicoccus sp. WY2]
MALAAVLIYLARFVITIRFVSFLYFFNCMGTLNTRVSADDSSHWGIHTCVN